MGKASRNRRRAAAVKARRTRSSSPMWYALTGVIVIVGVLLVALAKGNNANAESPKVGDHWHAALGVYMCDHWQGGGNWTWPSFTQDGVPARAGTSAYAGLHSHGDGIIHIEPRTSDETG